MRKSTGTPKEQELERLFYEVRRCFNQLKAFAELLHSDLGVTPSMRAVLETLFHHELQSVPDIAQAKGVSRQHIQTVMNQLLEAGLVDAIRNPAHKRSPLFGLSAKGGRLFREIQRRERAPLQRLAASGSLQVMQQTRGNLEQLNQAIAAQISKESGNETAP